MSSPPEPEHSEPIFIILSGFKGRYHSIQRAYNYGHPALEWSRKEVKQTIKGGGDPNTDFPDNNTREMSTWADDENGIYARFGFTVVEKTLTLPGPEELPYGTSQVHMVCDEQNLEISYVSTDHSDAEKVCEKQAGSVVKSVEYVRQQDFDRIKPTEFTMHGKPIGPTGKLL